MISTYAKKGFIHQGKRVLSTITVNNNSLVLTYNNHIKINNPHNNHNNSNSNSNRCYYSNTSYQKKSDSTLFELPVLQPIQVEQEQQSKKGVWQKLMDRYSVSGQQRRIERAETLFQAASRQASDPRWYGPGRIGRDFRPRHAMLTLHIWLLHKRLLADNFDKDYSLQIDEELFNILWDDTTCRIRQTGVMELSVNKNLLQVQQYTFLHLTHYDHAYTNEFLLNPIKRLKELRHIIWHHIFIRDPNLEKRHDHLDRIAWYIDMNYQNIMFDWPEEYYKQSRVQWVNLPNFDNIVDTDGKTILPNQDIHPDDTLPEPWCKNITMRGVDYYWNPQTGISQWEKPTL